jgi:hypothetical protein
MMIKVFTLNINGKIEISEEELRKLLDDSYWEGYYDSGKSWVYTSPNINNPITNPSITFTTDIVNGESNAK